MQERRVQGRVDVVNIIAAERQRVRQLILNRLDAQVMAAQGHMQPNDDSHAVYRTWQMARQVIEGLAL